MLRPGYEDLKIADYDGLLYLADAEWKKKERDEIGYIEGIFLFTNLVSYTTNIKMLQWFKSNIYVQFCIKSRKRENIKV